MGKGPGRRVLITGASAGIGRAAARAFAARGDRVIAVARSLDRLGELAEELGRERLLPLAADVADPASMLEMAAEVGRDGPPDVIVANAGIGLDALFVETGDDALRSVFEVNVFGVVRTLRPFLPAMVQRGSGRVVIVSSIVGKRGTPHYSAYSASKFALHGMADSLRSELWRSGVSVGLICPSSTSTEFQDNLLREGPGQHRVRPRTHTADSVAAAIVRMADSRRSEMILGGEARLLWLADAVAPGFIDGLLARMLIK
jgi:short-subunit dehydrogenase